MSTVEIHHYNQKRMEWNDFAQVLSENFCKGWPALSSGCIHLQGSRDDAGSINDFLVAWESKDPAYEYRDVCRFKKSYRPGELQIHTAAEYVMLTGLYPCEGSDEWPDKTKRHTTYLRGDYVHDGELGGRLRFLVKIEQRVRGMALYSRISVATGSPAISVVMANACLLYHHC